jgi:hypothetical protein
LSYSYDLAGPETIRTVSAKQKNEEVMRHLPNLYWIIVLLFLLVACKEAHEVKPAHLLAPPDRGRDEIMAGKHLSRSSSRMMPWDDLDANPIYGIPECALDDIYTFVRRR